VCPPVGPSLPSPEALFSPGSVLGPPPQAWGGPLFPGGQLGSAPPLRNLGPPLPARVVSPGVLPHPGGAAKHRVYSPEAPFRGILLRAPPAGGSLPQVGPPRGLSTKPPPRGKKKRVGVTQARSLGGKNGGAPLSPQVPRGLGGPRGKSPPPSPVVPGIPGARIRTRGRSGNPAKAPQNFSPGAQTRAGSPWPHPGPKGKGANLPRAKRTRDPEELRVSPIPPVPSQVSAGAPRPLGIGPLGNWKLATPNTKGFSRLFPEPSVPIPGGPGNPESSRKSRPKFLAAPALSQFRPPWVPQINSPQLMLSYVKGPPTPGQSPG